MLHVCGLSTLHDTVSETGATHLLSVINEGTPMERPLQIEPENHLFLGFNDINAPLEGHIAPARRHVEELLQFASDWPRKAPLVVHCWAGVSRSTASAYMIACAANPDLEEEQLARALRRASPSATPNSRLISFADDVLGRDGRMVSAIQGIGRGEDCFEGTPFRFWDEEFRL